LGPHIKKGENTKNKKYMFEKTQKNNNSENGCQNAQKMVKYWLRMFTRIGGSPD